MNQDNLKERFPVRLSFKLKNPAAPVESHIFIGSAGDLWLLLSNEDGLVTYGKIIEGLNDDEINTSTH